MENIKKDLISYIISISVTLLVVTYLLKIPNLLTNNNDIIKEYYYDNFTNNIPLDFLLIIIYIIIGNYLIKLLKVKSNINKLLIIGITTTIISGGFYIYFTSKSKSNNFFSRWFHIAGVSAIFYDVILLIVTYAINLWLKEKLN